MEAIEPGKLLRLRAEMKLPGLAWLELSVGQDYDGMTTYSQRAIFGHAGSPVMPTGGPSRRFTASCSAACSRTSPPPPNGPNGRATRHVRTWLEAAGGAPGRHRGTPQCEDPARPGSALGHKPKFAVNGSRSCAELPIVDHMRADGWQGVWVNAFRSELRSEWFPAPAARTLAETGAPRWAVEAFDRLRAANGRSLGGFFDVFAWREPGEVEFYEAKVGPDRVKPTRLRFAELASRFHRLEQFTIAEVAGDRGIHDGVRQLGQAGGTVRTTRRLRLPWAIVRGAQGRGPGILASRPAAR